ncbi:hypothetical protein BST61_g9398 [Cercospora zeina]
MAQTAAAMDGMDITEKNRHTLLSASKIIDELKNVVQKASPTIAQGITSRTRSRRGSARLHAEGIRTS